MVALVSGARAGIGRALPLSLRVRVDPLLFLQQFQELKLL